MPSAKGEPVLDANALVGALGGLQKELPAAYQKQVQDEVQRLQKKALDGAIADVAGALPGGAGAQKWAEQAVAEKLTDRAGEKKRREHLFFIPMHSGPATAYSRKLRHWMHFICGVQAVVCLLRFVVLIDVLGGFWMVLLCSLGWYAWQQDMNLTYICCWGAGCLINGIFDALGTIIPLCFGILTFHFLQTLVRVAIPVSELAGAAFAWHLYRDHLQERGQANVPDLDPLGKLIDEVDPEESTPLKCGGRWPRCYQQKSAGCC